MIIKAFCIYDAATEAFQLPFYQPTVGAALRMFTDAVNDPKSNFSKHPEDFSLFETAEFDDATGGFFQEKAPKKIITALEVKEADNG